MHWLQQLHFRPDFFVVAACETESLLRSAATRLCESVIDSPDDLALLEWDTALVCNANPKNIQPLLLAGRTVALSLSTEITAVDLISLRSEAVRRDCRLMIFRSDHADAEFSAVMAAVSTEDFGPLRSIRRSICSAGVVPPEAGLEPEPFADFALTDLAQAWDLLHVGDRSHRDMTVQAIPLPGMDGEARGGYLLLLRERGGLTIEIRRSTRSVISEDTGWQIAGTHRGFRNHAQVVRTPEDEIYELPASAVDLIDPLDSLQEPIVPNTVSTTTELLRCFAVLEESWRNGGAAEMFISAE
ncbi:hypothetical protein [Thalassoroseus pseudoceratinae]|uniref:hypothetical protein n=1 Tax=Thalassoroseus pseudoceratinae TaxID=2713176 RepID=UPI00142049C7|nr:hypothetical protein [Thalassoroseus pseudoceratinae]